MHQQQEERAEKAIAMGLGGGVAVIIGGFVLAALGLLFGALATALGIMAILGGIAWVGFSLYQGIQKNNTAFEGPAQVYEDVKILSRSAYDSSARLLIEEWEMEEPDTRFYVKIELARGNRIEFECAREIFFYCAEGSRGTATTQGKWLSLYIATVGPGASAIRDR
jgi:hypothetical protein